jgi:hypothetical protein
MIDVQVKIEGLSDLITSVVDLPGVFQRSRGAALRSLGWAVQQDLKTTGRAITPKLNPHTGVLSTTHAQGSREGHYVHWSKRRVNKKWTKGNAIIHGMFDSAGGGRKGWVARKLSTRLQPFSRFINMVRYQADVSDLMVEIGLLRPKANYWQWMAKNTAGFGVAVTPKMRRMLFAAGFPIKKETKQLRTPARGWIDVVRRRWETKATQYFESKFWANYDRYATGSKVKIS